MFPQIFTVTTEFAMNTYIRIQNCVVWQNKGIIMKGLSVDVWLKLATILDLSSLIISKQF